MKLRNWGLRLCALAAALLPAGCAQPEPELPYGTMQLMMANHVQPTAQEYWDAVRFTSELIDGKPVDKEYKPETDADWDKLAASTVRLAELAEALKSPAYADGRGDDWPVFAQGLIDAAARAGEAAKAHDPDRVLEEGGLVYRVCSACHEVYLPENAPETAPDAPS